MIECYYSQCQFHSCHYDDIGPLCEEQDCRANEVDLVKWSIERQAYLDKWAAEWQAMVDKTYKENQ